MRKRVISSLLVALFSMSIILPALAIRPAESNVTPVTVIKAESDDGSADEPDGEPEPANVILLDGIPQDLEYKVIDGIAYAAVASFVFMADPQAEVEEEDGVVTVSSARTEPVTDDEGNAADAVQETLSMTVSASVPYIVANGRYLYAEDGIVVLNDCMAAPVRILAQAFNLDAGYDADAHSILLTRIQDGGAYIESGDSYYDVDALYWLSHIINAESGNQSLEGMIAVGNVVMNRVNSPEFPDTIYDVLYERNQFSPAASGSIKRTPNDGSVVAAKLVLEGVEVLPTALFFNMAGIYGYAARNRNYVATIGDHEFYE